MRTALTLAGLLAASLANPAAATPPQDAPARIGAAERVRVDLVLIDLVVRDRNERPVSGLTRDAFELLVDRLPVDPDDIVSFEEVCAPPAEGPPTVSAPASPPAEEAPDHAASAPSLPPRHMILYFDFSHMSLEGRRSALRATRPYLATRVGPQDRVMILAFKRGLRLVQDFTSDPALLAARMDEMSGDILTLDTDVLEEVQNLSEVAGKPCDSFGDACGARRSLAGTFAVAEELRARRSLAALEALMPSFAGLRGRKALVLFTDTLRDEPGVQYLALARTSPLQVGIDIRGELVRLAREANDAGISFYTVHASGLTDWALESFRSVRDGTDRRDGGDARDIRGDSLEAVRTGLDAALALQTTLAVETGGRALKRTNDLTGILESAQRDLSCYYLLGYRHEGRGDGRRHSLIVQLKERPQGRSHRGLTVRHRPYYIDRSSEDRLERLVRSALQAPELFRTLTVQALAFDLVPEGGGRRTLVAVEIPLSELSLLPSADPGGGITRDGLARVQLQVRDDDKAVCSLQHEVPISIGPDEKRSRLVFETVCRLNPGQYDLVATVVDRTTMDVGARRTPLKVGPATRGAGAHLGDLLVWARREEVIRVAAGGAELGLPDAKEKGAFVPSPRRRLQVGQEAMLSIVLCPAAGESGGPDRPFTVRRDLLGDGGAPVAEFPELTIAEPPDKATGCYQVLSAVPPATLGKGIYHLRLDVTGPFTGSPLSRLEPFLVE